MDKNQTVYETIYKIYRQKISFYKIAAKHEAEVTSVAFSPDGKTILTGSWDKTARLWRISMSLEDFLKKGNLEKLTEEQKREYGIEEKEKESKN